MNRPVPLPSGFPASVVSIQGEGHAVAGWWIDRGPDTPVVLLLHPVRANRLAMVSRAKLLIGRGYSVLLIDLQAHGETPGRAITFGVRESADVRSARDWIRKNAPGRKIGAIGCSLGGAAVLLGRQPAGFDAVVLEAVYPRARRAIENRLRMRVGPLAPFIAPLLTLQIEPRLGVAADDIEPIRGIAALGAPVLVVAGSHDAHTTIAESYDLYHAAREPKQLWIVNRARHQDFLEVAPAEYEDHVVAFLDAHL